MQKPISQLRKEAFEKYNESHLPSFKYAQTVGTSFGELDLEEIDFSSAEDNLGSIDFDEKEVKKNKVIVCGIQQALLKYPEIINKHLFSALENPNKFTLLHMSFAEEGAFVYIPKGAELKTPIVFTSLMKGQYSGTNILIVAEENSKLTFIDLSASVGNKDNCLKTNNVEIFAAENASVKYISFDDIGKNIVKVGAKNAVAQKDASIEWFDASLGGQITKVDTTTQLDGTGATCKNRNVFFGSQKQHFDFAINVRHNAQNTISDVIVNGALKDTSKAICRGTIKITENGTNSNGKENLHILLLDEGAEADPIPVLEIDTNDVKCSHSASVGRLDEEKLFYLKSRGIDEKEAKRLIVSGFFSSILDSFGSDKIKSELESKIEALLQ